MRYPLIILVWLLAQLSAGSDASLARGNASVPDNIAPLVHTHKGESALPEKMCLSCAQNSIFSGGSRVQGASVRSLSSTRRVQSHLRGSSRVVRCGKIIDIRNFDPILTTVIVRENGATSFARYIYSICCLRI